MRIKKKIHIETYAFECITQCEIDTRWTKRRRERMTRKRRRLLHRRGGEASRRPVSRTETSPLSVSSEIFFSFQQREQRSNCLYGAQWTGAGRLAGLILDGSWMGKWAGLYFSNNKLRSLIFGLITITIIYIYIYFACIHVHTIEFH